jgi:hypothetical protein
MGVKQQWYVCMYVGVCLPSYHQSCVFVDHTQIVHQVVNHQTYIISIRSQYAVAMETANGRQHSEWYHYHGFFERNTRSFWISWIKLVSNDAMRYSLSCYI